LADYRQYFYLKPFSLAVRGMHYGRYFGDSESSKLRSIFIGYGHLIRGYSIYSFDALECTNTEGGGCPEYDRLQGSKMALANIELRFPFSGPDVIALIPSKSFPITLSAFVDMGMAWWSDDPVKLKLKSHSIERIPVFSTGISSRFNINNVMILEAYYAIPFQRPQNSGNFGLVLSPAC